MDQYDCVNHIQTNFTILKRGLVENSSSQSAFSVYDVYKMMYLDVLK